MDEDLRYEKQWEGAGKTTVVLAEKDRVALQGPQTIGSLAKYIGKIALVSLPPSVPPRDIHSNPPSASAELKSGFPFQTAVLADQVPRPPDAFVRTKFDTIPAYWQVLPWVITPASGWLESQVTVAQLHLYTKCVENLMGQVGHRGSVVYQEKTKKRERDLTIKFVRREGVRRHPCEVKRSDSAGQATWSGPPWGGPKTTSHWSDWSVGTMKLMKQAGLYMDDVGVMDDALETPVLCALSCAPPNRLHLLAKRKGEGASRMAVTRNMVTMSSEDGGRALIKEERWAEYFLTFMWLTFILAVGSEPEFSKDWEDKFGGDGKEAVEIARHAYDHLGEKCQPTPLESVALSVRRTKNSFQRSLGQLLLWWLPLHLVFKLTSRLNIDDTNDTLAMEHDMATLPLCGGTFFSNENSDIWTFKDVGIVIKSFKSGGLEAFGRELEAYKLAEGLQGDVIPVLYGWGHSETDGLPYIVTSYVGSSIDELTPSIIATLETSVIPRLHEHVHHHDIWEGNVVVTPEGRVMLIDLGEAVASAKCGQEGACPDSLARHTSS